MVQATLPLDVLADVVDHGNVIVLLWKSNFFTVLAETKIGFLTLREVDGRVLHELKGPVPQR